MATEAELGFGPFRLNLANEQLWQEEQVLPLTPKAFAVLRYLVEHPGQLVTKDALFQAV
jgi:DNA-binding response OmpR family regulator